VDDDDNTATITLSAAADAVTAERLGSALRPRVAKKTSLDKAEVHDDDDHNEEEASEEEGGKSKGASKHKRACKPKEDRLRGLLSREKGGVCRLRLRHPLERWASSSTACGARRRSKISTSSSWMTSKLGKWEQRTPC
jgi:hypothetical protein